MYLYHMHIWIWCNLKIWYHTISKKNIRVYILYVCFTRAHTLLLLSLTSSSSQPFSLSDTSASSSPVLKSFTRGFNVVCLLRNFFWGLPFIPFLKQLQYIQDPIYRDLMLKNHLKHHPFLPQISICCISIRNKIHQVSWW